MPSSASTRLRGRGSASRATSSSREASAGSSTARHTNGSAPFADQREIVRAGRPDAEHRAAERDADDAVPRVERDRPRLLHGGGPEAGGGGAAAPGDWSYRAGASSGARAARSSIAT